MSQILLVSNSSHQLSIYTHFLKLVERALFRQNGLRNDEGHHITMWTARGAVSGIDWRVLTEQQLKDFGVKYHELRLDKPFFDIFVDDKTFNSLDFFDDPKSFIK